MGASEPGQKKLPSTFLGRLLLGFAVLCLAASVVFFFVLMVVLPD